MCAVTDASLLTSAGSCSGHAFERSFCWAAWVARNPPHRRLRATSGRRTIARTKSSCAGRYSALNRRKRFHICRKDSEQPAINEPAQKFHQIRAKQFGFDIEFSEKFPVSSVNVWRSRHKLPHPSASLVQSEVLFSLDVQQDRFSIHEAN